VWVILLARPSERAGALGRQLTPLPPSTAPPSRADGVGQTFTVTTPATIANADYQATGVRMKSLPITPEKLFWAMKEKREAGPGK